MAVLASSVDLLFHWPSNLRQVVGHRVDFFGSPERASAHHSVQGAFPGAAILSKRGPHGGRMALGALALNDLSARTRRTVRCNRGGLLRARAFCRHKPDEEQANRERQQAEQRHPRELITKWPQGLAGSTCVLRSSGAASGEAMNLIMARAASGCFDVVNNPTLEGHGLFREPGNGPTYTVPGTPTMMLVCWMPTSKSPRASASATGPPLVKIVFAFNCSVRPSRAIPSATFVPLHPRE